MSTTTTPIPADVLLNKGQKYTAKLKDGSTVEVLIALVPVRKISDYLNAVGNLSNFVGYIIGKDEAFVDDLDEDELYEIDRLGKLYNDPRVARFLERQAKTLQEIGRMTNLAQNTGSQT
jgi:hypothetical protein